MGLIVLFASSCANRFQDKKDPLDDYYASRPRYQPDDARRFEPTPLPVPTQPRFGEVAEEVLPPTDFPSHEVLPEEGPSSEHGGGETSSAPGASSAVPGIPAPPVPSGPSGRLAPVQASGGGAYKNFGSREAAQIREGIFGNARVKQFGAFESLTDHMMDLNRGSQTIHSVNLRTEEMITLKFEMGDKLFCEDFTLQDTRIPSFYSNNRSLRRRWEGPDGKKALAEMQRVNRSYNKILRDFKAARASGDTAKIEAVNAENKAFWKTFMSCLAYSESGVFWDRSDSSRWLSNWNDYGIYQLNPDQRAGGNLNDCARNWNQEFPQEKIDEKKFRTSAAYRKSMVTTQDQRFNTFCGLSKIHQNLAHQSARNEGCLNPFKKTYNHFGALMQNSDLNFLRCTSKLLPSAGAPRGPADALELFRKPGKATRDEKRGPPDHRE